MKKIFCLITLMTGFISASAIRIEYGKNITISQPVHEDLYIAGGTVTINATIYGDLVVAGGTVIVNDTVTNDILLAGGTVTLNGFVGDDIRCAGGNILISKNVSGDVIITGGEVMIDKGVSIGGLLAGGGSITLNGNVTGKIKSRSGELFLNGNVAGDMDCRGGKIIVNGTINGKSLLAARKIMIGDNAAFYNDVRYWNRKGDMDFKQSIKNGKAVYDPSLKIAVAKWYYLGAVSLLGLLWYLGMALLMILIIQALFTLTMKKAAESFYNKTLKSLGWGVLFCIAVPVIAGVAFVTVVGVPVGLLLIVGYIVLLLLATVITSVILANWINNIYDKKWNFWRLAFSAFGIFILLKLVSMTPVVGWLIIILLGCTAFGSILINIKWRREKQ